MKFARIVYTVAAIYGFLVLTPLYFMLDRIARDNPPAITHAEFYYGFIGVALLFQIIFLIIARDPLRFRPIMLVTILEKVVYTVPVVLLFMSGGASKQTLGVSLVDPIFGVLFLVAYGKTKTIQA